MYATITVTSIPKNISTMELKITHEVTLPSTRLPIGGYVNRKFRLPGKGQPPENSLQAVLPVDCASSLLVPFLGRLPHGSPCTSRIADISMDCNRAFGDAHTWLPLWGALVPSGHQRLVSAAASVGDGRSPLGCITRAGRREWTRVSEDGEGEALPAGKNASLFP